VQCSAACTVGVWLTIVAAPGVMYSMARCLAAALLRLATAPCTQWPTAALWRCFMATAGPCLTLHGHSWPMSDTAPRNSDERGYSVMHTAACTCLLVFKYRHEVCWIAVAPGRSRYQISAAGCACALWACNQDVCCIVRWAAGCWGTHAAHFPTLCTVVRWQHVAWWLQVRLSHCRLSGVYMDAGVVGGSLHAWVPPAGMCTQLLDPRTDMC
jgi:hypothetical protein